MTTIREQCTTIKANGERCRGVSIEGSPHCFAHAPEMRDRKIAGNAKGGRHKSSMVRLERMMPARLAPVYERLEEVLDQLHKGKLDPRIAMAMSSVTRTMVALVQAGELEERLREVEEAVKQQEQDGHWPPARYR